ncbi:MAG: hypothetical protein NVS1B10_05450 [Candidatus Saccharimonadales bacterium]
MAADQNITNSSMHIEKARRAETDALFASIGDGAIATDEYGKITRINPAALQLLGYAEDELLGKWFPKTIIAVNAEGTPLNLIDRSITKAFLTGETISEKILYRKKNGQNIPVSLTVSPIIYHGHPTGAIEVFRDITLDQEIDRMKSEFISLASHQLRTPLSAIKTYAHMLYEEYMGKLNSSQKNSLNTIINASNRMNELISTLLNITLMESGTIAITPKKINICQLSDEVRKELSLLASDKSITITQILKGKASPTIKTDNLIVKEVMTNLLTNAIKYTPDGGKVNIKLNPRRADILVEISDSGWGIPEYSQDQIFSKFFRAQNIVKKETTGTGLGLYLVRGLLDALGGEIWFESQESKGTTFYFTIPRAKKSK